MSSMGMPQGAPMQGGNMPLQGQQPQEQGKSVTPEMEAKFQAGMQGNAGAMANFIVMVMASMGQNI
jgi:hypothetical protein